MSLATFMFHGSQNASQQPNQNYDFVYFNLILPSFTVMNVVIALFCHKTLYLTNCSKSYEEISYLFRLSLKLLLR